MGWLVAAGVVVLALMFRARSSEARQVPRSNAPAAGPPSPRVQVPAPVPSSVSVTMVPDGAPTEERIPSLDVIPPELLGVYQAGPAASNQDLQGAVVIADRLGRRDLVDYFQGLLDRRIAAERTFDVQVDPEADHDRTGVPVDRLELVEREVRQAPRGDRTVRQSYQSTELPTARMERGSLHALALRVADNLRRSHARAYDRMLLKAFQRGAGLAADGDYGDRSRQALGFYGQIPAEQLPASQY